MTNKALLDELARSTRTVVLADAGLDTRVTQLTWVTGVRTAVIITPKAMHGLIDRELEMLRVDPRLVTIRSPQSLRRSVPSLRVDRVFVELSDTGRTQRDVIAECCVRNVPITVRLLGLNTASLIPWFRTMGFSVLRYYIDGSSQKLERRTAGI